MASSSTQKSLSAKGSPQDVDGNVDDSAAKVIGAVSGEQSSVLTKMDLRLTIANILNLHVYAEAIPLKGEAEARHDAVMIPCINFVTDYGTPIGYYRQWSTQKESTAISRPRRYFVQAEAEQDDPVVKIVISKAGLEGRLHRFELSYNGRTLQGENKPQDLMAEIQFLRQRLHAPLLLPTVGQGSHKQIQPRGLDAVRSMDTDVIAAETEVNEQNIHGQTTSGGSDPRVSDYPMTAGHVEIQVVNEAVKDVSNAVLSLKNVIKDLPSSLSRDHQAVLLGKLEGVSRVILRFPDRLTSLLVKRKTDLDATREDRDAAAEILRAAKGKMMAAEAERSELVAKTETFEREKIASDAKTKEAADLLQAIETREKLVASREHRAVRMEEEQAFEDLNHGANAAMEDEAEAAAAEVRENERSTRPVAGLTAAAKNEDLSAHVEGIADFRPAGQHVRLGRGTALAAIEEELWHRANNLAFKETTLHHREAALFAREQLLERMKIAQIRLAENWKAQVDASYAGFEAEREGLRAQFRALIALKGRVEETRAKVRGLLGEAKGMVGVGGGYEGRGGGA